MHTFDHTVPTKPSLARIPNSGAFRVALILAVFAATGMAFSVFANDPGIATQPSPHAAGSEDWHGNVARSGR